MAYCWTHLQTFFSKIIILNCPIAQKTENIDFWQFQCINNDQQKIPKTKKDPNSPTVQAFLLKI